ncbi:ABC transporter permease [bacterium M21]|nr:ABC transporter permease [bacterium M21]
MDSEDYKNDTNDEWDLIIRPRSRWMELHLGDLWRYRDLVVLFVRRDFVAQFKQTILGPAWFVLQPLITTLMFTIVFGNIAQLSTDGLPKILFYFSGNLLWLYFAECLTKTSDTFATNAHLFGKVYFPRLAVPVSIVFSGLLRLGLQFAFFLVILGYYHFFTPYHLQLTTHLLLFPLLVLLMAGMALGLGVIFSSLTTKYRDLKFLLEFGVRLLMYATTVIYPLSAIPDKWKWLVLLNPMTSIIETFRLASLGVGTFNWWHLGYSAGFTAVILFLGVLLFSKIERTFMDTV